MRVPNSKLISTFLTLAAGLCILQVSCGGNSRNEKKFHLQPVLNKTYKYSFYKTSVKRWQYDSIVYALYDTVKMQFSLKKINRPDSATLFSLTCYSFYWTSKVAYRRDSLHARRLVVLMDLQGRCVSVSNPDSLAQDIEKDSATKPFLSGVIPDYISENGIKDLLNGIFAATPNEEVGVTNTWVNDIAMLAKAPVYYSNLFVLTRLDKDTAHLDLQSMISSREPTPEEAYVKGKQNGKALFSYSTGMPFLFDSRSVIVTSTNYYDIMDSIHVRNSLEE